MKKVLFVMGGLTFLCCMVVEAAIAGPAFESLSAAAGADSAGLSIVFDGVAPTSAVGVQTEFFRPDNTLQANAVYDRPQYNWGHMPIPEPVAVNNKVFPNPRIR